MTTAHSKPIPLFFSSLLVGMRENWRILAIIAIVVWDVQIALIKSIDISTNHLDGAFQTASGLYRLSAGQLPGRDFFPYLGVGPLYLLYPLFWLMGSDVAASLFSSYFATLIVGSLTFSVICKLAFNPKHLSSALLGGFLIYNGGAVLSEILDLAVLWSGSPGNSLRPIRSSLAYLPVLLLLFPIVRFPRLRYAFAGCIAGAAMLWSNDFAFATVGTISLAIAFIALRTGGGIVGLLAYAGALVATWALLLSMITMGHGLDMLRYNLIDVARNQWWVFGPYEEPFRIFKAADLYRLFWEPPLDAGFVGTLPTTTLNTVVNQTKTLFACLVLAYFIFRAARTRSKESAILAMIGMILFGGGAVASVGGHLDAYFQAFFMWGMIAAACEASRLAWRLASGYCPAWIPGLAATAIVAGTWLVAAGLGVQYSTLSSRAKSDPGRFFVSELGGYLPVAWKDYVQLARTTQEPVIEEYWGIWSAVRRALPAWPVDAVIHAFGESRKLAKSQIADAQIMTSTRYAYSHWQNWNISVNYWFYERLIANGRIVSVSPNTLVWRNDRASTPQPEIPISFDATSNALLVSGTGGGYYEVELDYLATGEGRFVLMVRNNFDLSSWDPAGYMPMDPKGKHAKFLVYLHDKGSRRLDFRIIGNDAISLNVTSVRARPIIFSDPEVLRVPDSTAVPML